MLVRMIDIIVAGQCWSVCLWNQLFDVAVCFLRVSEFEVNIVIVFVDDHLVSENFPIKLTRV